MFRRISMFARFFPIAPGSRAIQRLPRRTFANTNKKNRVLSNAEIEQVKNALWKSIFRSPLLIAPIVTFKTMNFLSEHTDSQKEIELQKIYALREKISKLPFESFSHISSSPWTFSTFKEQMEEPIPPNLKLDISEFKDFAEKFRQDYLLMKNPGEKQIKKEQFLEIAKQFLLKLENKANLLGDEKGHRSECQDYKINDIKNNAQKIQALSTEFESKIEPTNKPSIRP